MFDFFDNQQNPFSFMMNMTGNENASENEASDADPMQFMQQMFMMQMQFMQTMCMMPFQMMHAMANMLSKGAGAQETEEKAGNEGFKIGNFNVPPELLSKLMQMDMTPENLEKLQRVLDFMFESMPQSSDK